MSVSFHPLAEQELNDAAARYTAVSSRLAVAFLTEVQRCCDRIAEYPAGGRTITQSVRRQLVRRFPYAVLYSVRGDVIRVLAIMNMKRRPSYWVGRG